jgi:hypothetical protein
MPASFRFVPASFVAACVISCGSAQGIPATAQGSIASHVAVADEPFSVSLRVGQRDTSGKFLGGTELINLVDYRRKLYAGNGYWMDVPGDDPTSGPQILVLDSPHASWRQEHVFADTDANGRLVYGRLTALTVLTFRTDARGAALPAPVSLLAVGLERRVAGASGAVFTRSDDGAWTPLVVDTAGLSIRALAVHKDAATGADVLFIGAGQGEDGTHQGAIFTGVYDEAAPGRIRVSKAPEFTGFVNRVMSFAEVNGTLVFAAKPALYARSDASPASWTRVASVPTPADANALRDGRNSGVRGLMVVNAASPWLLGGMEGVTGPLVRFDPSAGFAPTREAAVGDLLQAHWGRGKLQYVISAYNDMPDVTDFEGGHVNLIGLQAHNPRRPMSAWYLVRSASGDYSLHEVPALTNVSPYGLVAVRAMHVSPFPEDAGQALYLGGCDADYRPSHNTAWLYRVGLKTALTSHEARR